ncbi:MAG: DUF6314 family protein [Fusobacteriaceae bacterium]
MELWEVLKKIKRLETKITVFKSLDKRKERKQEQEKEPEIIFGNFDVDIKISDANNLITFNENGKIYLPDKNEMISRNVFVWEKCFDKIILFHSRNGEAVKLFEIFENKKETKHICSSDIYTLEKISYDQTSIKMTISILGSHKNQIIEYNYERKI